MPEVIETLTCPDDVSRLLDDYASVLTDEFKFQVSRQQAFERMVRVFLAKKES